MPLEQLLTGLEAKVGTEIIVGDWITITQEQVGAWAEATGDNQWIHVDVERATAGPYGGTIVPGMQVLASFYPSLSRASLVPGTTGGVIYGYNRIRWPSATRVGTPLRHQFVPQSVEAAGEDGVQVTMGITVEIEGETRPACVAEIIARYFL